MHLTVRSKRSRWGVPPLQEQLRTKQNRSPSCWSQALAGGTLHSVSLSRKEKPIHQPVHPFLPFPSPAAVAEAPQVPGTPRWLASHAESPLQSLLPDVRLWGIPKPWVPSPGPDPSALPATLNHPPTALSPLAVPQARQSPLLCLDPCSMVPACSVTQTPYPYENRRGLLPVTHCPEEVYLT